MDCGIAQVMAAEDKNGKGLIDGVVEDYQLSSLCSTDFKFSVFDGQDVPVDAFAESKLIEQASKFNV